MGRRGALVGVRERPRGIRRGGRKLHRESDRPGAFAPTARGAREAARVAARGARVAQERRRERRTSAMTSPRWAAILAALVFIAVSGLTPSTLFAQTKPPAAAPADTTASAAKHQAAMAEWKSKILPAAKKEGEVIWYSSAQA